MGSVRKKWMDGSMNDRCRPFFLRYIESSHISRSRLPPPSEQTWLTHQLLDAARGADDDVRLLVPVEHVDVLLDGHASVEDRHAHWSGVYGRVC